MHVMIPVTTEARNGQPSKVEVLYCSRLLQMFSTYPNNNAPYDTADSHRKLMGHQRRSASKSTECVGYHLPRQFLYTVKKFELGEFECANLKPKIQHAGFQTIAQRIQRLWRNDIWMCEHTAAYVRSYQKSNSLFSDSNPLRSRKTLQDAQTFSFLGISISCEILPWFRPFLIRRIPALSCAKWFMVVWDANRRNRFLNVIATRLDVAQQQNVSKIRHTVEQRTKFRTAKCHSLTTLRVLRKLVMNWQ